METTHYKPIEGTPFSLGTSVVKNKPGIWDSTKVSIFRGDQLIGEYIRNYRNYGFETFCPFKIDNDWYALYSAMYTATRVMKLHTDRIEDWCGEEPSSMGFCPTEYYVPRYNHSQSSYGSDDEIYDSYTVDCDVEYKSFISEQELPDFKDMQYCNFGFLSGCIWGDDTSWKLRYIDLSQIPNKVLSISEKFGYWELPNGPLRNHIRMTSWEPGHDWIALTREQHINLKTNERC